MAEPITTWLNQIHAVPLIGLRWYPGFTVSEHEFLQKMRPVLKQFPDDEKFTIEAKGMGAYQVDCGNYRFTTTPNDLTAEFCYSSKIVTGKNAMPELKLSSQVQPFDKLFAEVQRRLKVCAKALPFVTESELLRIGTVATCRIERGTPPPGISLFVKNLGSPWGIDPDECRTQVRVELARTAEAVDRCHHHIGFNARDDYADSAEVDDTIEVRLDWQRCFLKPMKVTSNDLETRLEAAISRAVDYFQAFGRGDPMYANA